MGSTPAVCDAFEMSMYVSARPVRRRRPVASRGDMLLQLSGRKTVRRALESPRLKSPVKRALSPESPRAVVSALSISAGPQHVQYDPVPRTAQQPEEGVPPSHDDTAAAGERAAELAHAAEAESAMRQQQEAAARQEAAAALERKKAVLAAAAAADAEKKKQAAKAKRKQEAAAKQKAASGATAKAKAKAKQADQTAPHPQGAITEYEFGQGMKTLQGFMSGKVERTHPDGTPLKIIMENKRFQVYACEVDGLLTTLSECQFNTSAENMFKALTDFDYQKTYDEYIKHKSVIDHVDGCEVVFHELKLPSPLTNRDYVYYRKKKVDAKNSTYQWMQRDLPNWGRDKQPEVKGVIRAGRGDFWLQSIIQGTGKDTCTMTMYQTDNFAGDIPKWVMNKATKVALPAFFKDVEIAGQQLYVDAGVKTEKDLKAWTKAYKTTV